MKTNRGSTFAVAAAGILLLILILVFGTIWMGRSATSATEEAVHSVSLLYMDELAERRAQVVQENLEGRISDLQSALALMTAEDLSDLEHLQAYQARMKKLYTLEKFAFVDTDGRIYTSLGMQDNIGDYHFDPNTLTGPEISILDIDSTNKKVIIAVPVDAFSLQGEKHHAVLDLPAVGRDSRAPFVKGI